jgi:outer membrane protein TolC
MITLTKKQVKYLAIIVLMVIWPSINCIQAQQKEVQYTLEDVIRLAHENSIDALLAKQIFKQNSIRYRSFKSSKLPQLDLNIGLIDYYNSIGSFTDSSGTNYYQANENNSSGSFAITQNIPLTGGTISAGLMLSRNDMLNTNEVNYRATPRVTYNQPLFGYNQFKFDNKIEPNKYRIAKANYLQASESVSLKAIDLFFALATEQVAKEIAVMNLQNADTLFKISQGRFIMGKISENELLQMELNYLNSQAAMNDVEIQLYVAKNNLRSFLRISEYSEIELDIPDSVPSIQIDVSKAKEFALLNNPIMLKLSNDLLSSQSEVAQRKAEKGVNADLSISAGYARVDRDFPEVITEINKTNQSQNVNVSLTVPLLDWGVKRSHYEIALLNEEIVSLEVEQAKIDFEQSVVLQIMQFNQQYTQFEIAKKSKFIAEKRFEVSKQRFFIGKIDVLDLNLSQKDRDSEKSNYMNVIKNYWTSYYTIRRLTLFDFKSNKSLDTTGDLFLLN